MGYDYALVHLYYNIPPAIVLSFLYRPLLTKLDIYRIGFLITVAVLYTIPWDSYLIRTGIWSYPRDVIVGPKLFDIPLEEVFFFVIQTYNTSLLYLIFSRVTFKPIYIRGERRLDKWKYYKLFGQVALAVVFKKALSLVRENKEGTYMGLILLWAIPVVGLLWVLAYQFILGLPWINTWIPITLPTLYLWVVDTLALRRGTWLIEAGTKYDIHVWPHLEIEEAVFFLTTNILVVFGLVAFDNAIAILDAFPYHFPNVPALPSPVMLVKALLLPAAAYDEDRILGIKEATTRLSQKSRSFYLASGAFSGRLRIDLVMLYSFCRVADDLVDNSESVAEARTWIKKLGKFLDISYQYEGRDQNVGPLARFVVENFPKDTHAALLQLQTRRLSKEPLYDLLKGFDMDLKFKAGTGESKYPIKTETDLDLYSHYVAGTVAQLCIEHCLYHATNEYTEAERTFLISAGDMMGMALQYTNIARDIQTDAAMDRIYIPTTWLKKEKLTPADALKLLKASASGKAGSDAIHFSEKIERLRLKLLDRAAELYSESRPAINKLPAEVRPAMRVAVESYMEIGRTLRQPGYVVRHGRATVPMWRRLLVAWRALSE